MEDREGWTLISWDRDPNDERAKRDKKKQNLEVLRVAACVNNGGGPSDQKLPRWQSSGQRPGAGKANAVSRRGVPSWQGGQRNVTKPFIYQLITS